MSDQSLPPRSGPSIPSPTARQPKGPTRSLGMGSALPADASPRTDDRIISVKEQQEAFRTAQRHTRFVTLLKIGLPLIAIGIVAGFVSWVSRQQPVEQPVEVAEPEKAFQQDELIMQNPSLNGFTDGRSYEVEAERAVQKLATPDVVYLEKLSARITDDKEQWVALTAKTGQFNQAKEWLALKGAVDVKSSIGYDLRTEAVEVEMKKGYMKTLSPVEILSKDVLLKADQLEAIDNGEHFRFMGNVTLRIDAALLSQNGANQVSGQESATQGDIEGTNP